MADFDLLNDQALTPQLLRASKPLYALAATIPPPTCLTGGATASGEQVDILRSLTPLPGNHTLRFTHVAIGLDLMDEYPDPDGHFRRYISEGHCGRIRDFSIGDREDRQMLVRHCVDDSQRRYTKRTSFSLIVVLSGILPAVLCETIGESIRPHSESSQVLRFVAEFGRASHTFCRQRSKNQDTDWFHLLESPSSFSRVQLSHAGHPHCTQLHSEYASFV